MSLSDKEEQVEMSHEHVGHLKPNRRTVWGALAVLGVLTLVVAPVHAQDPDDPVTAEDGWHFTIAPYLWATGMDGTVSFEGTPEIPVEATFSDILDNLDLALAGHLEGRKGRAGFALDAMYVKIGAQANFTVPIGPDGIQGRIDVDLQQTILEGLGFYRVSVSDRSTNPGFVDVFAGFRYFDTSQEVTTLRLDRPRRDIGWTDGLFGVRGYAPLGDRFGLMVRGDLGVFSSTTWSVKGDLHWRMSNRWRLILGYKFMDIDYDKGGGLDREVYKMQNSGPELAIAFSW